MRCNNCGLDYIADNAAACPRCNAPLQMGYQQPPQQYQQPPQQQGYQEQPPQQYQQPPQQYGDQQYQQQPQGAQQPPQGGYYAPPQGGYYQQPPMPPKRVPTVKRVDLTEILMVVSGLFLFVGAFGNFRQVATLSQINVDIPAGIVILGIVCLVGALLLFVDVLMPALLKQLGEIKDILVLVLALVFIIWGLITVFADTSKYGIYGPDIFTGGFALLAAGALRMGVLK
ncbi:MAG TPA: hypothetical protein PLC39_06335 [Methanomassiliicoccales archaeon]|nr:hypothetical protein [Methanomassiliicoccales archaeon]HPR98896.1 hypothetical protein [Methanomassiliicoccales archaeon]